jgi:hypothetical protein
LTAAELIVVFGTNAACGKVYDPLPFLGMVAPHLFKLWVYWAAKVGHNNKMLWKIVQCLIVAGVVCSNGAYQWTPNNYVAFGFGLIAAFVVTYVLSSIWCLIRGIRPPGIGDYFPD